MKRLARSGRHNAEELLEVVRSLAEGQPPPLSRRDHALTGDMKGFRECRIRPDWLLVYRVTPDQLELVRTGSHADLFG
jgi:mRNA interferase YafQ